MIFMELCCERTRIAEDKPWWLWFLCYKEGTGHKLPIMSVQLLQQNLPLIPSRHWRCAQRNVERGEIARSHAEFAPVPQLQWRGGQPCQTDSVCVPASLGNVCATSQHLVSPQGNVQEMLHTSTPLCSQSTRSQHFTGTSHAGQGPERLLDLLRGAGRSVPQCLEHTPNA